MGKLDGIYNLGAAEKILTKYYESITLISELPISSNDYKILRDLIQKKFNHVREQDRIIRNLIMEYPYGCLTFTVFTAIYYYDGNFWGHFQRVSACNNPNKWKVYLWDKFLQKELSLFDQFGAQKYVSTILGHAGVPKRSMPGFTKGFLVPAVSSGLEAEEALLDLRANKDTQQSTILHKGVIDYLTSGGDVARDFVDRCLHVLKNPEKPFKDTYKGLLPVRILKGLEESYNKLEEGLLDNKDRIRPPVMYLDSLKGGVYFHLPTNSFSSVVSSIRWKISIRDAAFQKEVDCYLLPKESKLEALPQNEQIVVKPNKEYEFSLVINGNVYKQWIYSTKGPLIFSASDGTVLQRYHSYTGDYLLVVPDEWSTRINPEHSIITGRLKSDWISNKLLTLTPGKNDTVTFKNSFEQEYTFPIHLKKESPFLFEKGESIWGGNLKCYVSPPSLCFPKTLLRKKELFRWSIFVKSGNLKSSSVSVQLLKDRLIKEEENYKLSLTDLPFTLEPGIQEIQILGPLGKGVRLPFLLLPPLLLVHKLKEPVFPGASGYKDAKYTISIDKGYSLESHTSGCDLELVSPGLYTIFIPQKISKVMITARKQGFKEIPLTLLTKKINWEITEGSSVRGENEVLRVHEEEISKYNISLESFFNEEKGKWIDLKIELRDELGRIDFQISRKIAASSSANISLSSFYDSVKHGKGSRYTIFVSFPKLYENHPIPLFTIEKEWIISNVYIKEKGSSIELTWKENTIRGSRIIRIWNEEKPWEPYLEYNIPNKREQVEIPRIERDGRYLIEWTQSLDNDVFWFLNEINYPKRSSHTFIYEVECNEILGEPDLNAALKLFRGFLPLDAYVNGTVSKQDLNHMLQSIPINQMIQCINTVENPEKEFNLICVFINLFEWKWEDIEAVHYLNKRIRKKSFNLNDYNFGSVQGDIKPFLQKSYESLRNILHDFQFEEDVIADFSISHKILQYVLKIKRNKKYEQRVRDICTYHLPRIRRIFNTQLERGKVPTRIRYMVNQRWSRSTDPSYNNYPYLISILAYLNRVIANDQSRINEMNRNYIQEATREICNLDESWLFHDAYILESIIKSYSIYRKGVRTIEHSSNTRN